MDTKPKPESPINFSMGPTQIALIEKYLKREHDMFEWGAGGSTLHFSSLVTNYISVESHPGHFDKVKAALPPERGVELILKEPNRNRKWFEGKRSTYVDFRDYVDAIDDMDVWFDRILVDGRARVQCAIKALPYLTSDGLLFFHDFFYPTGKREHYHDVLLCYDLVDKDMTGQTLAVLKPKKKYRQG